MEYSLIVAIVTIGLAVCIMSVVWSKMNYKKQIIAVKGINYRKEHGLFDAMKYAQGNNEATVPEKQKNSGPDPETYNKSILYVNHFDTID